MTLNDKIYTGESDEEIPPNVWQTWKSDSESIYLPQNFSVNLKLENKNSAPLNVSVKADLNGFSKTEKIFPKINLAADLLVLTILLKLHFGCVQMTILRL